MFLAVETSSNNGGLALLNNGSIQNLKTWSRTTSHKEKFRNKSHSELITEELQALLQESSVKLSELKGLVVTLGPGSFTGIRVGINLVKTLSYSLNLPIYAFNSLEALAFSGSTSGDVLCMINAYKNMVYLAAYRKEQSALEETLAPQALPISELAAILKQKYKVFGNGLQTYENSFDSKVKKMFLWESDHPTEASVEGLATLFFTRLKTSQTLSWKELTPLYLRPSSAEENRKSGLLKPLAKLE